MHPADIKALLEKAGYTQISLAKDLKVSDVAVNHVIYGRHSSRRIAKKIAEITGKSLEELWPGRYPPKNDDTTGGHR
jgi:lambda repressor-like predicted transcriptional regulator